MLSVYIKPLIFSLFILLISTHSVLWAADKRPELPRINDARNEARLAQQKKLPILIMFGTEGCPFCQLLKEDFLIPMIISGDYINKVILREEYVAADIYLIDFAGKKVSSSEFARRYGVSMYPTTVLVDHTGEPLVGKIIGVTTPSLFGGTLDDAIDKALLRLRPMVR